MRKLWFLSLIAICWNCKKVENKHKEVRDSASTINYSQTKEIQNVYTTNDRYYKLMLSTDSTYKISWNNGVDEWSDDIDINLAQKLIVKWQNDNFLILKAGTGPGT
jgi:hypothetical protein